MTPTTRSPSPSANSVSVAAGLVEMMRRAGAANSTILPRSSFTRMGSAATPEPLKTRGRSKISLGKERILQMGKRAEREKSPTTACQLRAGVDRLFPNERNTRELVLQNVGLSYVELDGDVDAANRFYLEDLAIGLMRPPFNVGVEH